jgi:hypothetical protein
MPSKPSPFTALVKQVFREELPHATATKSEWTGKSNIVWAIVHLDDPFVGYFIVQRTYGVEMTGEVGFSQGVHPPFLFGPIQRKREPFGARERVGDLMGKGDTWWPCSQEPEALKQEVAQLVRLLMRYSGDFFERCAKNARGFAATSQVPDA